MENREKTTMIRFTDLIAALLARRVRFDPNTDDGRLHWRAPKGALTPELRRAIARYRPLLLRFLGPSRLPDPPSPAESAPKE